MYATWGSDPAVDFVMTKEVSAQSIKSVCTAAGNEVCLEGKIGVNPKILISQVWPQFQIRLTFSGFNVMCTGVVNVMCTTREWFTWMVASKCATGTLALMSTARMQR